MKTIRATVFVKPNVKRQEITLTEIYPEDAEYINENKIAVSMEDVGTPDIEEYVLYFDHGQRDDEGEPVELLELSKGRSCKDTIKSAVESIKEFKLPTE